MELLKSGKRHYHLWSFHREQKKFDKFWSTNSSDYVNMWLMFTHPKSILSILLMLIHLSLSHETLLQAEFQPSKFYPHQTYGARRLMLDSATNL